MEAGEISVASVERVSRTVQRGVEARARREDRGLLRRFTGTFGDAEDRPGRQRPDDRLEHDHRVRRARAGVRRAHAAFLLRGVARGVRADRGRLEVGRRARAFHAALSVRFRVRAVEARGKAAPRLVARGGRRLLGNIGRQPVARHRGAVR